MTTRPREHGPSEGDTPACTDPSLRERLGAWELGLLDEDEAVRVEAHVLSCRSCFVEAYETAPATDRVLGEPTADAPDRAASRHRARSRLVLAGSLAASLVLVAALVSLLRAPTEDMAPAPDGDAAPLTRSGPADDAIAVLSPVGEVARPMQLDWEPLRGARRYELRLSTARGRLVWSGKIDAPPAALPEEVGTALEPGATYYWQVEAQDAEGVVRKSELARFTIAR